MGRKLKGINAKKTMGRKLKGINAKKTNGKWQNIYWARVNVWAENWKGLMLKN